MRLFYAFCFLLVFTSCKQNEQHLTKITAKNIVLDSTIQNAQQINDAVSPYKEKLIKEMQQVLSYTPKDLVKNDGEMQSSLGNIMADLSIELSNPIHKEKTGKNIDFAMLNNGGIRSIISAGNITKEDAFKLMPFENELVAVELSGDKMIALIKYFIENKKAHPLSKNIALTIKGNDYDLKINGETFDKNKTYTVVTSDYLQSGGDKMTFFKNPKRLTKLGYKLRTAIIDYFKKVDTIHATIDNRVIIK
ncbi:5'-nucleotidase C-terminal domain-containing protein [uncultured Tenacibaculum sp.]|uniref:5'-nucleotidase C-terminal domain-containing protein n=1 Tax=uncultured Tenacibaculum sp. TaxID=174713 RepID=UPI002637B680|nr:5'-nucleotidase C-terminal domain-containing protein [uncultured Tenacibaculum sp.]